MWRILYIVLFMSVALAEPDHSHLKVHPFCQETSDDQDELADKLDTLRKETRTASQGYASRGWVTKQQENDEELRRQMHSIREDLASQLAYAKGGAGFIFALLFIFGVAGPILVWWLGVRREKKKKNGDLS